MPKMFIGFGPYLATNKHESAQIKRYTIHDSSCVLHLVSYIFYSELLCRLLNRSPFSIGLGVPTTQSASINRQRIATQAHRQGKWSEDYEVEDSQDNPCLEVADLPRNPLPPFPGFAQY